MLSLPGTRNGCVALCCKASHLRISPPGTGAPASVRPPSYVVWATLTHPSRSWAVGYEIRPGYLKVVAYAESKLPADSLAKRLDLTGIGSANSLAPVLPSISVLQALKPAQLLADSFAAAQTEKQMSLMVTIPGTGTGVHKARFKNHQYSWALGSGYCITAAS
jgi:hypothetical protein